MKTEDLKRYGYELPRNGVANDLRNENAELRAALDDLLDATSKHLMCSKSNYVETWDRLNAVSLAITDRFFSR